MKRKYKFFSITIKSYIIYVGIIFSTLFTSCVSTELKVSEFKFIYNNSSYVVRSAYCPNDPESCNQLISDRFVAIDMNQDRIIDKITIGDISLSEAQEIYDYCLQLLENQNKLQKVKNVHKSFKINYEFYDYEINTFYTRANEVFNEFSISRNTKNSISDISIYIDKNSDGLLNEIVKGSLPMDKAQENYNKVIQEGIKLNKLHKINQQIIVK